MNIKKRLSQHNKGSQGARYTRTRRPVLLSYYESFETLHEARVREIEIKKLKRAVKMKLINSI